MPISKTLSLCFLLLSSCSSGAKTLPIPQTLNISLPAGFQIEIFADLAQHGKPRMLSLDSDGQLVVALVSGKIVKLSADGQQIETLFSQLNSPNSVAIEGDEMWISEPDRILKSMRQHGIWSAPKPIIRNLAAGGHALKTVRIGPDHHLYLNIGSSCNVCVEEDASRATIARYTRDGVAAGALVTLGRHKPDATWARGLRNSQAFAWHPITGQMFATNEGADNRSGEKNGRVNDELPPEHFNIIEAGKHYGWPYCWGDGQGGMTQDPNFVGDDAFCKTAQAPTITFTSHATPIGFAFLHHANVPIEFKNDAIVALHGSWNRAQPSGYKLVRVKFSNNQPVEVENFATGWLNAQGAWGRPVDVIVGKDGSLYVSDDRANVIYRISTLEKAKK